MPEKYIYGGKAAQVKDASKVSGVLIRTMGGYYAFRVYDADGNFIDYVINHDDLPVTIDENALSAFYSAEGDHVLDHNPQVLGLKKI